MSDLLSKKPHVLFVTEKWRDAKPNSPKTSLKWMLFDTLESAKLATQSQFYYDEFFWKNNIPCDDELIRVVVSSQPDLVVFCFIPWFKHIPTVKTVQILSDITKCVIVWPDAVIKTHFRIAEQYEPYTQLSILLDTDVPWIPDKKFIHLWTPTDSRIFKDPGLNRNINVSFVGTTLWSERSLYLNNCGIDIYISGGNKGIPMPIVDYARVFQRSKISLNFCLNGTVQIPQLKGRIFEVMTCGALLMESVYETNWIDRWFIPYIHYVPFYNEIDLTNKIRFYLENEEIRSQIAKNGYNRCKDYYNSEIWWTYVFKETNIL